MNPQLKRGLTAGAAIAVIAGSCFWIYRTQFKAAKHNVLLHQAVGEVMAAQTARIAGNKGRIVLIAIETKEWPELQTQIDAFKAALHKLGDYDVREYELDTRDQPKYGVGSGLSGRRYIRIVNKNTNADVFVSFVGAPRLSTNEVAELENRPRLIVESRSTDNLAHLFEKKLIEVAVVSRFQYPSPGTDHPKTAEEWFAKRYQIVTPEKAGTLPKSE